MIHHVPTFSIPAILGLVLLTTAGCAGLSPGDRNLQVSGIPYDVPELGARYDSVESAAVAALVHTQATATRAETDQLRAGSIVSVGDQYTWEPATGSGSGLGSGIRPTVRFRITENHVATYIVQPRSGDSRLDRANEDFTRAQRRFVNEADPLHRPMFLLTPSRRILSLAHGTGAIELADVRTGRIEKPSTALGRNDRPGTLAATPGLIARSE